MPKQSLKSSALIGTKSNFLNKLVPRTRKAQLVVFLLVFALIGGGTMAYRSFAASNTQNFFLAQGFGTKPPFELKYSGDIRGVAETSGQKKNLVVVLLKGKSTSWAIAGALKPYANNPTSTYFAPGKYRVCAAVKAEASSARFILAMLHEKAKGGDPFQNGGGLQTSTNEYKNVCQDITATQSSWPAIIVGRGAAKVSVLSITPIK